jgi:hypothetical protein
MGKLLVIANAVPNSNILFTLMLEAIRSSETSVITRDTRCHNPVDGILHSHCRETLKSSIQTAVKCCLLKVRHLAPFLSY